MRLTYKGDYAVKTILALAKHYGTEPVTIHELAERADIPVKFLEQILLDLKSAGFVESRRGKIGGYLLARHPSKIKLGEIIRFIDGPIEPIACVDAGYAGCKDKDRCVLRGVWSEVAKAISGIIDNVTFEDLARRSKITDSTLVYQI